MTSRIPVETMPSGDLYDIVRVGIGIGGVGKMHAINMIASQNDARSAETLIGLMANHDEQPRFRRLAAVGLLRAAAVGQTEVLERAAEVADGESAAVLARGLGRLGGPEVLPLIMRLAQMANEPLRPEADFAATLLAYRHGLQGFDVRAPSTRQMQVLTDQESHSIDFTLAKPSVAREALAAMDHDLVGIDVTATKALRIDCTPTTWMWLWSSDCAQRGLEAAARGRAVLGLLYMQNQSDKSWSLAALGLGTDRVGGIRMTVHRARTGNIMYTGLLERDGSMRLRARKHAGLAAVDVRVTMDRSDTTVDVARSASFALPAREPQLVPRQDRRER